MAGGCEEDVRTRMNAVLIGLVQRVMDTEEIRPTVDWENRNTNDMVDVRC